MVFIGWRCMSNGYSASHGNVCGRKKGPIATPMPVNTSQTRIVPAAASNCDYLIESGRNFWKLHRLKVANRHIVHHTWFRRLTLLAKVKTLFRSVFARTVQWFAPVDVPLDNLPLVLLRPPIIILHFHDYTLQEPSFKTFLILMTFRSR